MTTHGKLIIHDKEIPLEKGPMLSTWHSGNLIPKIVKEAPLTMLKARSYLNSLDEWQHHITRDETLADWLLEPHCLAALLIATRPLILYPFDTREQEEEDQPVLEHDYVMVVKNGLWELRKNNTKKSLVDMINPVAIITKHLSEPLRK